MKQLAPWILTAICLVALPAFAVQRLALLVGANTGWSMDQPLRHAHDDARRLADTLVQLGEFAPADVVVLEDPTTDELRARLAAVGKQLASTQEQSLVVFYYSGHSDDQHLHLRGKPLPLEELYRGLQTMPATVRLAILDACQSGALVTTKGGRPTSLFKVQVQDELAVKGLAILASSGADELSQEARNLEGSFFTHHLVSGLRGAADGDGDGRVSLGEAFGYASARTTLDTAATATGAQRPSFRYELNGRGELYLTRLQGPVGVLEFPSDGRRCFVTDLAERTLIAEVHGEPRQGARLAIPAGSYLLKCRAADGYLVSAVTASKGDTIQVAQLAFRAVPLSNGVLKGSFGPEAPGATSDSKKQGFAALRAGRPEVALALFSEVLNQNLRDAEGYRGKAQAYLALAERAGERGDWAAQEKYRGAALRTDPRLDEDPPFLSARSNAEAEHAARQQQLVRRNLRQGYPRRYQRLGIGVGFADGHGSMPISFEWVLAERFQLSATATFVVPGVGARFRAVPRSGTWSPFFGAGGHLGLATVGLFQGPDEPLSQVLLPWTHRSTFDRVAYLDAGFQAMYPNWQLDLGAALLYSAPLGGSGYLTAVPVLSAKFLVE